MKAAKALLLAALCGAGCARYAAAPVPAVALLSSGPLVLSPGADLEGLRIGGLSAVTRAPDGSWLSLVDNDEDTPARVFRLDFEVGEEGVTPPDGKALRNVPVGVIRLEGFNGKTIDAEGLVLEPSGRLLVSSEIEPSIREFSLGGKLLGELTVPAVFKAGEDRGVRTNEGFESLALSPEGNVLWTANERALRQDAPADKERPSPVRLLRYERRGERFEPTAQYVYEVEPIDRPGRGFSVRGLVELLVLPGGDLLALEREYVELRGFKVQLYRVSLTGATDVAGLGSLAGKSYTPVRKTLLYDFADAGFVPDNIEGLAFGPVLADGSRTLVLVSDNNFLALQQTQIVALRFRR